MARSRVHRLPEGDGGTRAVYTAADRAAAVEEFMASPEAAEAVAADEASTRFWAEVLTGYSGRIPGEPPDQVGPRKLAHILLGHVPNTFVLTPAQRGHLEPAVTAWVRSFAPTACVVRRQYLRRTRCCRHGDQTILSTRDEGGNRP